METGQEVDQGDINLLKQELVGVFITTLQQNRWGILSIYSTCIRFNCNIIVIYTSWYILI